jgi:hypothetical protein
MGAGADGLDAAMTACDLRLGGRRFITIIICCFSWSLGTVRQLGRYGARPEGPGTGSARAAHRPSA